MERKTSKKMIALRLNNYVLKELESNCENIGVSMTSFIEIAIIEKMAKLRAYSSENAEISKIYEFVQNIAKNGSK